MFGLEPIDYIKINKQKLADIYNASDIEAINYIYPFCEGELKELCERVHTLNVETDIGWGREPASPEEFDEYVEGKWKLLNHFGLFKNDGGDAYVK